MKCLRCGYCCKNYFVAIVNDPELGIREDNIEMHEGQGNACKHLKGEKVGEYSCSIHDKKWYKETPCFSHGQYERKDSNCRLGEHLLKAKNER